MQASPTRRGNPGVREGLLFGVIIGIISIVSGIISNAINGNGTNGTNPATSALSIIVLLIGLVLYLFAGFRASMQTGRVGTGAIAGLIAGLIASIISSLYTIIYTLINVDALRQAALSRPGLTDQARQFITNNFIIGGVVVASLLGIVVALGLGAGLGAIGGLIGRRRAPQPQQYQESMYQGLPPTPPPPPANNY